MKFLTKNPENAYGSYDDGYIGCPRAKTDMTPCAARDGATATDVEDYCVGCGQNSAELLKWLVKELVDKKGIFQATGKGS